MARALLALMLGYISLISFSSKIFVVQWLFAFMKIRNTNAAFSVVLSPKTAVIQSCFKRLQSKYVLIRKTLVNPSKI